MLIMFGGLRNDCAHTEMQKVIKIAAIHFWPKKISTKKLPKNDPKLPKWPKNYPKWPKN